MPDVEVKFLRNGRYQETLRETESGWVGVRHWAVYNQPQPYLAGLEPGVAQIGDPWSLDVITLTARDREILPHEDATSCRVKVTYRTPGAAGNTDTPVADGTRTRLRRQVGSETVNLDATGENSLGPGGAPRAVVTLQATVSVWVAAVPSLAPLVERFGRVNDDAFTLPNVEAFPGGLSFDAGQLLYLGPDLNRDGDLLRVDHAFALGPSHEVVIFPTDHFGDPTGDEPRVFQNYPETDFAALGIP